MSKATKYTMIKFEDIDNYEIDEAANDYPMLTEQEHNRLAEDIRNNGQLQPVVIFKNRIIDGRNRVKAVKDLEKSLKAVIVTSSYEDALKLAQSNNDKRRHMSKSQFAMKAAYRIVASRKDSDGNSTPQTDWMKVQKVQEVEDKIVGSRNVESAIRIALNNEVLAKEVFNGEIELQNAIRQLESENTTIDENISYFRTSVPLLESYKKYIENGKFTKNDLAKRLVEAENRIQELSALETED